MKPRQPTQVDLERMKGALGLVTAYDLGVEEGEFDTFGDMVKAQEHTRATIHALTQFAWVLLTNLDTAGIDKESVLDWYGKQFAQRAEELRDE